MTATTRGSGHDWDDARKAALFARIVGLELSIEEAAKLHGLRIDVIQEWLRLFRRSALLAFDERLKKTLIDQGANADALAAAEFTGHIEDVSIADLVQTIEIAGKDAVITVTHDGQDHKMWCSAGAIIDAESGRLSGEAAVYRILSLERGRMVADLRPEPRERTIYAATHRLLLEAMRRNDESGPLLVRLGNVDRCYRLGERSTSARVCVSTDELSILRSFDGPRRIGDVLAQSQLGDFETLSALVRLLDHGYLRPAEPVPSSRRARTERMPSSERASTERMSSAERARTERMPSAERVASVDRTLRDAPPRSERAAKADKAPRSERAANAEKAARSERTADADNAPRSESAARSDAARAARALRPTQPRREAKVRIADERPLRRSRPGPAEVTAAAAAARIEHEEPPRSEPASYVPISISHVPSRTPLTPRWVLATMAAAVLAPAAFWFGETMSNLQAAARARAVAAAPVATLPPVTLPAPIEEPTTSFNVSTRVEPAAATIWLDHHPVASGRLEIELPRDGHTHELRATADGFVPITLMFADVAPPREIQLEPLPAPPVEPRPSEALVAQVAPPPAATSSLPTLVSRALSARPAPPAPDNVPARATAARAAPVPPQTSAHPPQTSPTRPSPPPAAPAARPSAMPARSSAPESTPALQLVLPDEPHVQVIDPDAPAIQVIE